MRGRRGGGDGGEVEGGHIVRSTVLKDRHSKVCTAKGSRDRRVRLSANTAIQFFDLQHRLGYDRPTTAVDWLINNAKTAIDQLSHITTTIANNNSNNSKSNSNHYNEETKIPTWLVGINENQEIDNGSGLLQPDITDTIKTTSFSGNQDLRLSFQPLQDPNLLHQAQNQNGFDGMVAWNASVDTYNSGHDGGDGGGGGGGGGFILHTPSPPPAMLLGQSEYLCSSQRGSLQSSNHPSIRAWIDAAPPSSMVGFAGDNNQNQHYLLPAMMHQSVPGIGFASGGFSGFRVPAPIQGQEEEHDGVSNKPSSVSSDSLAIEYN